VVEISHTKKLKRLVAISSSFFRNWQKFDHYFSEIGRNLIIIFQKLAAIDKNLIIIFQKLAEISV